MRKSWSRVDALIRLPFLRKSRAPRFGAYEAAEIDLGAQTPARCAVVKDISSHGARLYLENAELLPERVRVSIHSWKLTADAEIRWRKGGNIGVRFEQAIDLNALPQRVRNDRRVVVANQFRRDRCAA